MLVVGACGGPAPPVTDVKFHAIKIRGSSEGGDATTTVAKDGGRLSIAIEKEGVRVRTGMIGDQDWEALSAVVGLLVEEDMKVDPGVHSPHIGFFEISVRRTTGWRDVASGPTNTQSGRVLAVYYVMAQVRARARWSDGDESLPGGPAR